MAEIMLTDPVLKGFLYYSSILVAKVLFMVFFTARQRFGKKVFINPEDLPVVKKYFGISDAEWKFNDKDVERVRKSHLNDLENIPLFIFVAFAYTITKPDPVKALNIFKIFTQCRIFYTIAIEVGLPKSVSDLAWVVSYLLTFYMALICALNFY